MKNRRASVEPGHTCGGHDLASAGHGIVGGEHGRPWSARPCGWWAWATEGGHDNTGGGARARGGWHQGGGRGLASGGAWAWAGRGQSHGLVGARRRGLVRVGRRGQCSSGHGRGM